MSYSERGRHNPYDSYIAGLSMWMTPRQIVLLDARLKDWEPSDHVDAEAIADLREMVAHEAKIKRRKYFGGQS